MGTWESHVNMGFFSQHGILKKSHVNMQHLFLMVTAKYTLQSPKSKDPPPRGRLGVTYLPFALISDAGYADLPLALLEAPVDIGALVKTWVTVLSRAQRMDTTEYPRVTTWYKKLCPGHN